MTDSRRPSDPPEPETDSLSLEEEQELLLALALAQTPPDHGLAAHDRAWAKALAAEPDATPDELAAMARDDDAAFLDSLRAAHAPGALDSFRHERLLRPVLAPARRGRPLTWAASGLALAAAVLLAFRATQSPEPVATTPPGVELSRSTESIVASASAAGASTRVDRIAQARSGDYRKNRFRSWGAR